MQIHQRTTITRDQFECWLMSMDEAIARFVASVPTSIGTKLDYSDYSLDLVERWLLDKYPSHDDLLKSSESDTLDGASQYIGEVFRHYLGGQWDIELNDTKDAFYGIPKLTGFGPKSSPISPVSMTTALLNRRTGQYLNGILSNLRRRYSADRGSLI